MTINSVNSFGNQYQNDIIDSKNLGQEYKKAEERLENAVNGGDKGQILSAQRHMNRIDEAFNLLSSMLQKSHDTIMSIIRNIAK